MRFINDSPMVRRAAAGLILLGAFALLTFKLTADAPSDASDSSGLFFDAPSKCHNARNFVLSGRWMTDEWAPYIHSPVYTLLQALNFKLFGVGYRQMRMLTVLAALLTLALVYGIVARQSGRAAGWIALAATAISYPFLIAGRSGLLEPLEALFMLAGTWALAEAYRREDSRLWMGLAGLCAVAAFLSKAFAACFMVAAAAAVLIAPPRRRSSVLWFLAALAIPLAFYFGPFMHANADFFQRESAHWFSRGLHSRQGLDLWLRQPLFPSLEHARVLVLFACLAVPWAIRAARRGRIAPAAMALTLLFTTQFLAFFNYRPDRYYLPLLPVCIALGTLAAARAFHWLRNPVHLPFRSVLHVAAVFAVVSFSIKFGLLDPLAVRLFGRGRVPHLLRLEIAAAGALVAVLLWRASGNRMIQWFAGTAPARRARAGLALLAVVATAYAWQNVAAYRDWVHDPRYTAVGFSRLLGERYRDVVIAGPSPLFAVMENRHRALKVTDYGINWTSMESNLVTHLALPVAGGTAEFMEKKFPETMRRAVLLDRLPICGRPTDFYAVDFKPFRVAIKRESGDTPSLKLTFENPDAHNPQSAALLIAAYRGRRLEGVLGHTVNLLPSEKRESDIAWPSAPAARLECYALLNRAWVDTEHGCGAAGTYLLDDPLARGLFARTFPRPEKAPRRPVSGRILLSAPVTNNTVIIGARVRGKLEPGDRAELQWRLGEHVVFRSPILASALSIGDYAAVFALVDQETEATGDVCVEFEGRGQLFVDSLFAHSPADLPDVAAWHETLKMPKSR